MPVSPDSVTPNRNTLLTLDVTEPVITRPEWHVRRFGGQITRTPKAGSNTSTKVTLQPGGGWTLAPLEDDVTRVVTTAYSPNAVGSSDMNKASGWTASNQYRTPGDLSGVTPSGTVSSGIPGFTKQVPAGGSWNTELTSDVSALPKPTEATADVPVNRVLSSVKTYAENSGFILQIALPTGGVSPDTLCRFYFGGPADTGTDGAQAGQFCLTLRGNGEAILREYDKTTPWVVRKRFQWIPGEQAGGLGFYTLSVFPYANNTIAIRTMSNAAVASGGGFSGMMGAQLALASLSISKPARGADYYRSTKLVTGYSPGKYITGAGQIRMDVRRDLRPVITIIHLQPPLAGGNLVDAPFHIPHPFPADTPLTLLANAYVPKTSSLVLNLYRADTHTALTPIGANQWKSVDGVQDYYATFGFTPDSLLEQTPVLWGYGVVVDGAAVVTRSGTAIQAGSPRHVSITGPDLDPTHETASISIEDPTDALSLLRTRGRIRSRIGLYNNSGGLTSILFDGEVQNADPQYKGMAGSVWPSEQYRQYDVTLTGMWSRLADQVNMTLRDYSVDPNAAADPKTGLRPPYKVTDVLRGLLTAVAGFPAAYVSIPDIDIRLGPVMDNSSDTYVLQPGGSIGDFVMRLARDYLGSVLLWDPNAGSSGLWRLLANPAPPYVPIAAFVGEAAAGKLQMHPNSYPSNTAPIQRGSFRDPVVPPECNYVRVIGLGGQTADGSPTQMSAEIYNPASFDFVGPTSDPTNIDYLGRFVPVIVVDAGLQSPAAVSFTARRIYDLAAHGQKWAKFRAPLLLVDAATTGDALQARSRPLRINDVVTVLGLPAIIRSVNPDYSRDGAQFANYETLILPS